MLEMKAHTFQNLSDTSSIFKPSSLNTTRSCPGLVFPTFFRPFSFLLGSGLEILQLPAMVAGERLAGMLGCQGGTWLHTSMMADSSRHSLQLCSGKFSGFETERSRCQTMCAKGHRYWNSSCTFRHSKEMLCYHNVLPCEQSRNMLDFWKHCCVAMYVSKEVIIAVLVVSKSGNYSIHSNQSPSICKSCHFISWWSMIVLRMQIGIPGNPEMHCNAILYTQR